MLCDARSGELSSLAKRVATDVGLSEEGEVAGLGAAEKAV
jgi:hypothetical protein